MKISRSKTLIIVPTYNERNNLENVYREIVKAVQGYDLLIVDDNSPDGTGAIADVLAKKNSRVKVIHRQGKLGLGSAYVRGMQYALEMRYENVIAMDADLSHDPSNLPKMLELIRHYDMVIGSRYVKDGGMVNWNARRFLISQLANLFCRWMLGLKQADCSGGYKCYRTDLLQKIGMEKIFSHGYSFQVEILFRAVRAGARVVEIPIIFVNRHEGKSKLSTQELFQFGWTLLKLCWLSRLGKVKGLLRSLEFLFREYLQEAPAANALWRAFEYHRYSREKIQKPVLDLGCGDGFFVSRAFSVKMDVGLDIDEQELRIAKKRKCHRRLVQGDATHLPFVDKCFRTVFSNCVLEHIPAIDEALREIRRVLKPGGRLLMTVPSEYYGRYYDAKGLPACGGKVLTYLLNRLFRHHYVESCPSWQLRFRKAGLMLLKAEYLIPRKTFNSYLGCLIPAFPSKISKLLLGRWVWSPRGWLAGILPGLFRGILNRKDDKGVCYYFVARRQTP